MFSFNRLRNYADFYNRQFYREIVHAYTFPLPAAIQRFKVILMLEIGRMLALTLRIFWGNVCTYIGPISATLLQTTI